MEARVGIEPKLTASRAKYANDFVEFKPVRTRYCSAQFCSVGVRFGVHSELLAAQSFPKRLNSDCTLVSTQMGKESKGSKDSEAYSRFTRQMQNEQYYRAYRTFYHRPALTMHLPLRQIPDCYETIRKYVGHHEADMFKSAISGAFEEIQRRFQERPNP